MQEGEFLRLALTHTEQRGMSGHGDKKPWLCPPEGGEPTVSVNWETVGEV